MTTPTPVHVFRHADIADALRIVGKEDANKPATIRASRSARVLLETLPIATLVEALPPLWAQEEAKRRRRAAKPLYILLPILALIIVSAVLGWCGLGPKWVHHMSPATIGINALNPLVRSFGSLTPLQKGILRTLHLRSNVALVPLMIDALSVVTTTGSPVTSQEHRALLTRFLPAWCDNDADDLTPAQRRTLLAAIRQVAGRKSVLYRPVGQPPVALPLEDADFAHSAIAALRRCPIASADKRTRARTRRTLEQIESPRIADDPRHEVRIAADEYTALLSR